MDAAGKEGFANVASKIYIIDRFIYIIEDTIPQV